MKKITIGFSKGQGFVPMSDIIRWVLRSEFSHTYLEFQSPGLWSKTIFEASGNGVSYRSKPNFLTGSTVVASFELKISDQLYSKILNKCHDNAGIKYGYLQNLGIGFVKLLKLFGIKYTRNPWNKGMNCSEWCGYILQELYGKDWIDKEPNLVDPKDVYEFLKKKQAESGQNEVSS